MAPGVVVLYASETGNAASIAEDLQRGCERRGIAARSARSTTGRRSSSTRRAAARPTTTARTRRPRRGRRASR